jgi:AAA15 family ATPase/GTPase
MITSLEIENFRGLKQLKLSGLQRINVLVGPNASGKTALLESLFLAARANPQTALNFWINRGMQLPNFIASPAPMFIAPFSPPVFQELWNNLFASQDGTRTISISYTEGDSSRKLLKIYYGVRLVQPAQGVFPTTIVTSAISGPVFAPWEMKFTTDPISFERTDDENRITVLRGYLNQQSQLQFDEGPPLGPASAMFPSTSIYNENDNLVWFSNLGVKNREKEVLSILQSEFPGIRDLSVLSPAGISRLYSRYQNNESKLPITLISSGIHKVLSLVLASVSYQNGLLLIDEIENGIFYKRYKEIWSALHKLSSTQQNQIFVSTHSKECLDALLPVIAEDPDSFSLLRTEVRSDGCWVEQFDGRNFEAAIRQEVELRGVERTLVS